MDADSAPPQQLYWSQQNGNLLTWPGLNNQYFLKHLPPSIETDLSDMDQERKNFQSTKQVKSELEIEEDSKFQPDK